MILSPFLSIRLALSSILAILILSPLVGVDGNDIVIAAEDAGLEGWAFDQLEHLSSDEWLEPSANTWLYPEQHPVFYITGRGGSLAVGFSLALKERLIDFTGREINGEFLKLEHLEQVELIAEDLNQNLEKAIIANSYGAYLVLSALAQHDISLGDVFLTSPIPSARVAPTTYIKLSGEPHF